jgi:ATP-dependent exoDNAse (exonuclease V) alpha subunit
MTAGYTFTDYKSQGQTIEHVIIDIAQPPTGRLSPFSVYVALLQSRGRDTIRLLRKFDPNLFQNHPSEALRQDMRRLERLNEETKIDWETRQGHSR